MDADTINRINLTKYSEKMIELANELNDSGILYLIFTTDDYSRYRKKFETYGITPLFNFSLWKKLKNCHDFFNYLKISQKPSLKQKWLQNIIANIPEIESIIDETHQVFAKYKEILFTILNK